jgi:predicted outer membrane repeat protein
MFHPDQEVSRFAACSLAAGVALASSVHAGSVLYVDDDAPTAGAGLSWATAYRYLQDALADAAASGGAVNEIRVAQGTYTPDQDEAGNVTPGDRLATFQLLDGVSLMGGHAGLGTPDPELRDLDLFETTLSGDLLGDDDTGGSNAENAYHVVTGSGTDETAVLDGFTVTRGNANHPTHRQGAGLYNFIGSPTVNRCVFQANVSGNAEVPGGGAGMYNQSLSNATVSECRFVDNVATNVGGGMSNVDSDPTLTDCTFSGNVSAFSGGGIYNQWGEPTLINCLFEGNMAGGDGGGAIANKLDSHPVVTNSTFCFNTTTNGSVGGILTTDAIGGHSTTTISNCILFFNDNGQILDEAGAVTTVSHSDVEGGWTGSGNIDADPLLAEPGNGDYRLSAGSPCIDAGNNNAVPSLIMTDLDGNPRFMEDPGTANTGLGSPPIVDMGAYEFQGTSFDLNGDGCVGVSDFLLILASWGPCANCDVPAACPGDFDGDCEVGVTDFLLLLANWGGC